MVRSDLLALIASLGNRFKMSSKKTFLKIVQVFFSLNRMVAMASVFQNNIAFFLYLYKWISAGDDNLMG
jgi:hypothetical protein